MLTDEIRYRLMRVLQEKPKLSQRELARELAVSLGRVNYCMQALVRTGLVKARNFRSSKNKSAYAYLLTPRGIKQKAKLTARFLRQKIREHEALQREIEQIRREIERSR